MKAEAIAERGYSIAVYPEARSGDTFQCVARPSGAKVRITVVEDLPAAALTKALERAGKLSLLRHDHLHAMPDYWTTGNSLFLVHEAHDAMPISRLLALKGKLPENFACRAMVQIALALVLLHDNNLVHGMLHNTHVTTDRQSKVRLIVPAHITHCQPTSMDPASDCLHAGIALYEMLTAHRLDPVKIGRGEFLPATYYTALADQATQTALRGMLMPSESRRWKAHEIHRHFDARLKPSHWHRHLDKVRNTATHIFQSFKTP